MTVHQGGQHADVPIRYVPMPLLARAAWVPEHKVILIDEALDDAQRVDALTHVLIAAMDAPSTWVVEPGEIERRRAAMRRRRLADPSESGQA